MIKLTDLSFGQKLYGIDTYRLVVNEYTISGLVDAFYFDDPWRRYRVYVDGSFSSSYISLSELKKDYFFTKEKAEARVDYLKKQKDKQQERCRLRDEAKVEFDKLPAPDVKGKHIMILIEKGKWIKTTIRAVFPEYVKNKWRWVYVSNARDNKYLPEREGKNWKFWTKLEELKEQKKSLEEQIENLEKGENK